MNPTQTTSEISDTTIAQLHANSVRRYPSLGLNPDEYLIEAVNRSHIGLIPIWSFVLFVGALLLALIPAYTLNKANLQQLLGIGLPPAGILALPLAFCAALLVVGGLLATVIYRDNSMFLTNQSVILHIRNGLFHTRLRIIGLVNIEDASATKEGIIQQAFNYGTVHLTTKGEDVAYIYAKQPRNLADAINDAVKEALKILERAP